MPAAHFHRPRPSRCKSAGAAWSEFRQAFRPGFRRSTLGLVALLSAVMTGTFLTFFIYHEHNAARFELSRQGEMLARLLAATVQTPVYIGDRDAVRSHVAAGARTAGVLCIKVHLPDGSEFVSEPACTVGKPAVAAVAEIVIDDALYPEAAIAGIDPGDTVIGKVTVHMDYEGRQQETYLKSIPIIGAGLLLWLAATLFGYLLLRRLTASVDQLVEGMGAIERGETRRIDVEVDAEEIVYLAGAINHLSESLHAREAENLALQQELLLQMEARAVLAEETMHAKLKEANRLASLGTMASYTAHEINNPVGTIIINLDLLKDTFEDSRAIFARHHAACGNFTLGGLDYRDYDETMPVLIEEMRNGAQRIRRIVEDLKRFAKNESPELKDDVDLNAAVDNAVRMTSRTIAASTDHLVVSLATSLPPVQGNTQQIEQVLINLIINACQALPDRERKLEITTTGDAENRQVVVTVRDEGEGIPAELLPRLTDPFFTTKTDRGGTGVGLAITAKIIKDHGGTINFSSDAGKGMTVTFVLPAIAAHSDLQKP